MIQLNSMTRGVRAKRKAEEKSADPKDKRLPACALRVRKDLNALDLDTFARIVFGDNQDIIGNNGKPLAPGCRSMDYPQILELKEEQLLKFEVNLIPQSGFWQGAKYTFEFNIMPDYPLKPPKVKLVKGQIYHPNIDFSGNVCLNLLKDDWKPVLDLGHAVQGLNYLFIEPNPNDPLNLEVAKVQREDAAKFKSNVEKSLRGCHGRELGSESELRQQTFVANKGWAFAEK